MSKTHGWIRVFLTQTSFKEIQGLVLTSNPYALEALDFFFLPRKILHKHGKILYQIPLLPKTLASPLTLFSNTVCAQNQHSKTTFGLISHFKCKAMFGLHTNFYFSIFSFLVFISLSFIIYFTLAFKLII